MRHSLCDQRFVGQPLPGNRANETVQPFHGVTGHIAVIEAERKLVNVAAKMFRAGVVVDTDQAARYLAA